MSLKHAILGFLSTQPLTGYDLKKAFDRSIQHFWPANQSQIYRTLAELSEKNLVDVEVVEREDRLDMKIYHITPAGKEELHRWLTTPLQAQDYREPFLIQIYFGGQVNDGQLLTLLENEIHALEERQAVYHSIYRMVLNNKPNPADSRAFFLSMSTLEYGILNNQDVLDWLKSVAKRIRSHDYSLQRFE